MSLRGAKLPLDYKCKAFVQYVYQNLNTTMFKTKLALKCIYSTYCKINNRTNPKQRTPTASNIPSHFYDIHLIVYLAKTFSSPSLEANFVYEVDFSFCFSAIEFPLFYYNLIKHVSLNIHSKNISHANYTTGLAVN